MPFVPDEDFQASEPAPCRQAAAWVDAFFADAGEKLSDDVRIRCHRSADFPDPCPECRPQTCIFGQIRKEKLVLHACIDRLARMPLPAVQAALDLQLARFTLHRRRQDFAFNFEKKIRPSLAVSGGAVHIVRKMVWHLETALRLQAATRMVIDLDRGSPQVVYYLQMLDQSAVDRADYERMQRHDWVRALFLCRKCETYLSLFLLQQVGLSPGLLSFWNQCHPFLQPHDRQLLTGLAEKAGTSMALPFADRIVGMFEQVRSHLSF